MVKKFRIGARAGNGLNEFDLRVAALAERQMSRSGAGLPK